MTGGAIGRMTGKAMAMNTKLTKITAALLTGVAFPVAFDNGGSAGWKKDANGNLAVDANGNPIYVDTAGKEMSVEQGTISRLNAEAKSHRERAEDAEKALAPFKGIDPAKAREAIDTVSKLDAKKLIDAGEVDKVRDQVKAEFTTQLTEKDNALKTTQAELDNLRVKSVFDGSEFIRERVAMPRDFFEAAMRGNFKVEEGKVVAYDKAGNRLMSKRSVGEYASPDEALELLVDAHPQKDTILKAAGGGGSGNSGGGGNRGGGRVVRRADFDAMKPQDQAATAAAAQKGEITIAD